MPRLRTHPPWRSGILPPACKRTLLFRVFPGRSHFIFAEPGWEEAADIQADIPSCSRTELLDFRESSHPDISLVRTTEVAFPARKIALGGGAFGLKLGVNF
jgi:hypothetical protein